MYIRPGRPDIHGTLNDAISGVLNVYSKIESRSAPMPSGVVIGTCGPTALVDDATRAVGRVNWPDWNDVGGVESIEECVFPSLVVYQWVLISFKQGIRMVESQYMFRPEGCRSTHTRWFFG